MNPLADRQATINLTKPSSVSCRNPEKTNNTTDQTLIYNVYDLGQWTAGEFSGSCSTVKLVLETPSTYVVCSLCNFSYIILPGGMVVKTTDSVHVHACTMLYETHAVKHHCPTWLLKRFLPLIQWASHSVDCYTVTFPSVTHSATELHTEFQGSNSQGQKILVITVCTKLYYYYDTSSITASHTDCISYKQLIIKLYKEIKSY